jgi:hypothetical protein
MSIPRSVEFSDLFAGGEFAWSSSLKEGCIGMKTGLLVGVMSAVLASLEI